MKKKDIYEHLAHIYLDASSKKKKKSRRHPQILGKIIFVLFLVAFGSLLFVYANRNRNPNPGAALILCYDPVKINFHFNPAKKESYSVNLNKMDLSRFRALAFSAKKTRRPDSLSLRVEFTNSFREKSEVYIKDLPHKWQEYKIDLSDFKNISHWSGMLDLSFIIEEWNTNERKGEVYIDNLRFLS